MCSRILGLVLASVSLQAEAPRFQEYLLADDLRGGYQVVPYDVNRDGRTDLVALASGMPDLLWFENPGAEGMNGRWPRRVLARGLNRMINVGFCPGVDDLLVAHAFANQPKDSIGIVSRLTPGADRAQPWTVTEIDRLTTSHRIRCADLGGGRRVFVNAPLAGANAAAPNYEDHVPLTYYAPGEWKRVAIGDQNEGVMHGIFIFPWDGKKRDCILTASFSGIHAYCSENGKWTRTEIARGDPRPAPESGASDIAVGHLKGRRFIASIEPWHGNQTVIYAREGKSWRRKVIDTELVDGHTILTADLDGDGRDEVVAGYRGAGRSVHIYHAADAQGARWNRTKLDDGGIAAAACAAADLDGDRRVDLACIGSATTNLKWYRNAGPPANH
ncbi:MAG: FG-GAP-like repeat-containing protein [Bryobacteraceae bacterium]